MKSNISTLIFALFFCLVISLDVCQGQSSKEITNSVGMKLVRIPKGKFMMGSPMNEQGRDERESQHEVVISKDFYMGVHEVTQSQYMKVMESNPSFFQGRIVENEKEIGNHPVEQVAWIDAVAFCKRLSELPDEVKAGRVYRLPTEAEWEYACRAGRKTALSFGDLSQPAEKHVWFGLNSGGQTRPVGSKNRNAWGLYDMHGNVWEWCNDFYSGYPSSRITDPVGPKDGIERVFRGGSCAEALTGCRSAKRGMFEPTFKSSHHGFRVALDSPLNSKNIASAPTNGPRLWASSDGKFKVQATLVERSEDSIQIKRVDNGKVVTVPIEKLSATDVAYLNQLPAETTDLESSMDEVPSNEVASAPEPHPGVNRFQVPNYGSVPDFGPENPWVVESQSPLRLVVKNPGIKSGPEGIVGRASVTVERSLKPEERADFVKSTEERLKKLMLELKGRETPTQGGSHDPKESSCRIEFTSPGVPWSDCVTDILFQEDKTIVIESIFQGSGRQWGTTVKTTNDIRDVIKKDKGWLPKSNDPNRPITKIPPDIKKEIQVAASRIIDLVDQDKIRELLEEFISAEIQKKIFANETELTETIERFKRQGKPNAIREAMESLDWEFATYSKEKQAVEFTNIDFTFRRVDGKWTFQ
jgi:formylglycine-generating enzyme required for sulfatase activity